MPFLYRGLLGVSVLLSVLASAGHAQTSRAITETDLQRQYAAVKSVLQAEYNKRIAKQGPNWRDWVLARSPGMSRPEGPGPYYLLEPCHGGIVPHQYSIEPKLAELIWQAQYVVKWVTDLPRLGYPEAAWRPTINAFEERELELGRLGKQASTPDMSGRYSQAMRDLLDRLKAARAASPALPEVVIGGGCGAAEVEVKITTQPPGGIFYYIPSFFHALCRAQNIDPDNRERCNRWQEADDGKLYQLSGHYIYFVRWPDGATRRGTISFERAKPGDTVIVRKQ